MKTGQFSILVLLLAVSAAAEERAKKSAAAKPAVDLSGDPLPAGAKARLGTVRYRAGDGGIYVLAVAFTADGKEIVTATSKGPIRFWDPATGKQLRAWNRPPESSLAFEFTADAKRAVSIGYHDSKHILRGWDIESGKIAWEVSREEEFGRSVALSDDGSRAVTVSQRKRLVIWEALTGIALAEQELPRDVGNLRASPDGRVLVFSSNAGVNVWNWSAEDAPRLLVGNKKDGRFENVVFSPDGKTVVACDPRRGEVELFEVDGGKRIRSFGPARRGRNIAGIKFSPDGRWLAVGEASYRGDVSMYEVATKQPPVSLDIGPIEPLSLAFSPDSARIVVASPTSGVLRICDVKSGARLGTEPAGHEYAPHTLAVRSGGSQVVTGSHDTVRAWDSRTGKLLWHYRHGKEKPDYVWPAVGKVAYSPDGKWVASTSYDETVRIVEAESGREAFRLPGYKHNAGIVTFSPDSRRMATCDFVARRVRVWDVATGKAIAENVLKPSGRHFPEEDPEQVPFLDDAMERALPRGMSFSGDMRRVALSFGDMVDKFDLYVFDTLSGRELGKFAISPESTSGLAFSSDARRIIVGRVPTPIKITLPNGKDGFVSSGPYRLGVYDADSGKLVRDLPVPGHDFGAVTYSPDGSLLAAHSRVGSNTIVVFQAETGKEVAQFDTGEAHPESLAFSPDNKTLYSGMSDTSVLAWDLP